MIQVVVGHTREAFTNVTPSIKEIRLLYLKHNSQGGRALEARILDILSDICTTAWSPRTSRGCASRAVEYAISRQSPKEKDVELTLQGLFNSKPAGADGLSVCPLKYPVNLRSRSITTQWSASSQYLTADLESYFAAELLA